MTSVPESLLLEGAQHRGGIEAARHGVRGALAARRILPHGAGEQLLEPAR